MRISTITRITIDITMTVLFLFLMAYHITGNMRHEWVGMAVLGVFILHNIINGRWYLSLLKGKYSPVRILYMIINILFLASVISITASGIVISHDVFASFDFQGGMTAQKLHMASSSWGYILMSCHLGLHLGMVFGFMSRTKFIKCIPLFMNAALSFTIAGYGIHAFISQKVADRLFLLTEFPFFNYEEPAVIFFTDHLSILFLFAILTYHWLKIQKGLVKKMNQYNT